MICVTDYHYLLDPTNAAASSTSTSTTSSSTANGAEAGVVIDDNVESSDAVVPSDGTSATTDGMHKSRSALDIVKRCAWSIDC
jgi:hypothetical protein